MDARFEAGSPLSLPAPEPTPLHDYHNKVDTRFCPHCGKERALDFFGDKLFCWTCRSRFPELKDERYPTARFSQRVK